jgi:WD40 repeat protein
MPTRLWNLISRESRELAGGGNKIAFSHDHHQLVTAGTDARLWDLNAADPTATPLILRGSQDKSIQNVGFSPDDHWLVTGNEDGSVRVWNVKDPEASPLILTGHTSGVDRLAFSSDSHWLATGSFYDSAVRLWDLTSNKMADTPLIFPINGKTSDIKFSNESTGSHWLMTGNYEDHTVMLWNLRLNELRDLACRTAGRNLTEDEWRRYFPGQKYRSTCAGLPVAR